MISTFHTAWPAVVLAGIGVVVFTRFLHRKQQSPHRPVLTSFLDTVCELFHILKLGPWAKNPDVHTAMEVAMKKTKLSDWGEGTNFDWVKRYDLVRRIGLEKSGGRYSPVGHYYLMQSLERRMIIRLQMVEYFKQHPEISQVKMNSPVFVVGFTRTGTTFLHELLGLHEGVRMHYTWEQMDPVPATTASDLPSLTADRLARYNKNKSFFKLMFEHIISDHIQRIHRIGYDEPEECTLSCSFELPLALTELPFNAYAIDEISALGGGEVFQYYRKFLQMMAWQSEDRRNCDFTWMLKCPFHLPYLNELQSEFPDATIIWTHRDPADCIASACSLYETLMCMTMDESSIDKSKLGAAVLYFTKRSLEMAESSIQKLGKSLKILHVRYQDTVKTPKDQCRRVYEAAGLPFTSKYEEKVDMYLKCSYEERKKAKEKNSGVLHAYSPEDYGLTKEQIRTEFADYIAKYNL